MLDHPSVFPSVRWMCVSHCAAPKGPAATSAARRREPYLLARRRKCAEPDNKVGPRLRDLSLYSPNLGTHLMAHSRSVALIWVRWAMRGIHSCNYASLRRHAIPSYILCVTGRGLKLNVDSHPTATCLQCGPGVGQLFWRGMVRKQGAFCNHNRPQVEMPLGLGHSPH